MRVHAAEALRFGRLGVEGLDDADAGEVLVHARHEIRHALQRAPGPAPHAGAEDDDGHQAERQQDAGHEEHVAQAVLDGVDHGDQHGGQNLEGRADGLGDRHGDDVLDAGGIVDAPADQVPDVAAPEESERLALERVEELVAQVADDAGAEPAHVVLVDEGRENAQQGDDREAQQTEEERLPGERVVGVAQGDVEARGEVLGGAEGRRQGLRRRRAVRSVRRRDDGGRRCLQVLEGGEGVRQEAQQPEEGARAEEAGEDADGQASAVGTRQAHQAAQRRQADRHARGGGVHDRKVPR